MTSPIPAEDDSVSTERHSFVTDDDLGRRFVKTLRFNGDSKSEVLRDAIRDYVEKHEGETVESIERNIEKLKKKRDEKRDELRSLESEIDTLDSRIDDLEERLEEMRSLGDADELFEQLVEWKQSGADLWTVHANTDKIERMRRLGSYESVDEVIKEVEATATGGE